MKGIIKRKSPWDALYLKNKSNLLKNAMMLLARRGSTSRAWIKMGSQLSKYWKIYLGLTGSLSIGEIDGIILQILTVQYKVHIAQGRNPPPSRFPIPNRV